MGLDKTIPTKYAPGVSKLYLIEAMEELVETVLLTGWVRDEVPVSTILVGPSGSAKSFLIRSCNGAGLHRTDSVSSKGLWDIVLHDSKQEKRFIIMPDFNPTLSRKTNTSQATVANLLSLTTDGIVRIDDGRENKEARHKPMGMLTACTPEIYEKHAKQWFALGLRRRIIPIFYIYTTETIEKLQELVRQGKISTAVVDSRKIPFPKQAQRPSIGNQEAQRLKEQSITFSVNLGKLHFQEERIRKWYVRPVVPVSPHTVLRTLAMAHAIRRKSAKVEAEDVSFCSSFIDFTDPERPRQL